MSPNDEDEKLYQGARDSPGPDAGSWKSRYCETRYTHTLADGYYLGAIRKIEIE